MLKNEVIKITDQLYYWLFKLKPTTHQKKESEVSDCSGSG